MKRRSLFALTGLGLLGSAGLVACSGGQPAGEGSTSASKLETLRVHVPTTLAFMAPMASFGTLGKLDGLVGKTDVQNWASVDVMKSLVVNGETDLVATPSYASANLFNKGLPIRLVAMTVWGMLYILGPEGSSAQGVEGLKGKKVGVPMPNNMPDLVFRYLMTQSGIPLEGGAEGIEVVSYDQAPELVKALMSGQVEYAVLPEHVATVAQNQAKQSGKNLDRTANLQEAWAKVTGGQARFPMEVCMSIRAARGRRHGACFFPPTDGRGRRAPDADGRDPSHALQRAAHGRGEHRRAHGPLRHGPRAIPPQHAHGQAVHDARAGLAV